MEGGNKTRFSKKSGRKNRGQLRIWFDIFRCGARIISKKFLRGWTPMMVMVVIFVSPNNEECLIQERLCTPIGP